MIGSSLNLSRVLPIPGSAVVPPLSQPGACRMYFDGTDLQLSENGGPWLPIASVPSAGGWTDAGPLVHLTTPADTVAIGALAMVGTEKVLIVGDTLIQGNAWIDAGPLGVGIDPALVATAGGTLGSASPADAGSAVNVLLQHMKSGAGAVTDFSNVSSGGVFLGTGTVTDWRHFEAKQTLAGGDAVTNAYGMYIHDQEGAPAVTTGYGIWQDGGSDINVMRGQTALGATAPAGAERLRVASGNSYFDSVVAVGIDPAIIAPGGFKFASISTEDAATALAIGGGLQKTGAGTIPQFTAFTTQVSVGAGTVTTYDAYVAQFVGAGAVGTATGLKINDLGAAAVSYGIQQLGASDLNVFNGPMLLGGVTAPSGSEVLNADGPSIFQGQMDIDPVAVGAGSDSHPFELKGETSGGVRSMIISTIADAGADTKRLAITDDILGMVARFQTTATDSLWQFDSAKELQVQDDLGVSIIRATSTLLAFHNRTPVVRQVVAGSRGGNAALASLLTALDTKGLIHDTTTP